MVYNAKQTSYTLEHRKENFRSIAIYCFRTSYKFKTIHRKLLDNNYLIKQQFSGKKKD